MAASRPRALAMALSRGPNTIAKLRLTLPPGEYTTFHTDSQIVNSIVRLDSAFVAKTRIVAVAVCLPAVGSAM